MKCGDYVDVAARTGPRMNQHGGRAWVTAVHPDGTVDLRYVVEARSERHIEPKYVQRVDLEVRVCWIYETAKICELDS